MDKSISNAARHQKNRTVAFAHRHIYTQTLTALSPIAYAQEKSDAQAVALSINQNHNISIATCMRYRAVFGTPQMFIQGMKSCIHIS